MRGRAAGFGTRISSMGLLVAIRFLDLLTQGANHFFDECDFWRCQFIFLVKFFISPLLLEVLTRHK